MKEVPVINKNLFHFGKGRGLTLFGGETNANKLSACNQQADRVHKEVAAQDGDKR
jgi:hypothetical protein